MSETNNLRALLMAALVVMSVFAGVGTVSAVEETPTPSATDVPVGQDTATQTVEYNTTIQSGEEETVTIDASELPNVDVLGVGASFEDESNFSVSDSSVDDDVVEVTVSNDGDTNETSNVTLTLVHDTSDVGVGSIGTSATFTIESSTTDSVDTEEFEFTANEAGNNDVIFQGETVQANTTDLAGDLTLREVDERDSDGISSSSFVEQLSANENGYVEIDTDDLEGDYIIVGDGGVNGENTLEFEVAVQSLTANWSEDSVTQGDSEDLELESGRSDYIVEVSADGLDADELETLFGDSDAFVGTNDEDDSVYLDAGEQDEIPADFTDDIDAGDYEFDVEVTDTTASDTASIEVSESDADVNFADSVYTEQVGDVVTMSVEMEDRDEAYVYVGGDDVNYLEVVQVTDDDEDGMVNFTFNTYTANESGTNPFELVEDSDDELELVTGDVETEDNGLPAEVDGVLDSRLETGDYDLRTSTSLEYNVEDDEVVDEQDVATLDLGERSTNGLTTWTAASGNAGEFDDTQELLENVNQSNVVAIGDRLVVQVNASGTSGVIDEDNVNALLNGDEGMEFNIEEADAGANADDSQLGLDGTNTAIYQNETGDNDQFFVVVDTRNVDEFDDDTEYEAVFTVGDEDADVSPIDYIDDEEEESVSATFTAEEPDADLSLNDDDQFEVPQSQNAQVQFDTNLAGGSEVVVRLRSSASDSAFLLSNTVDTNGNGTVMTTFDTSDVEVGTEFDMIVRSGGDELASEDGIIVEGSNMTGTGTMDGTMSETPGTDDGMTDTETEMPTGTDETPTEGGESPTDGGETTTGSTDGSTPGFGVVVAVTALLAAALLAVRRD
ncbi:BGTF surface domain-containing protein [Halogeometricum luteum]|uniref:PGF-CTERM sorting domain-containing protein n=1 Tax=Halogeometricum luteum TaxID=2950537 RepID=A0ABU2G2Y9_9EURY|nr:BGTF surface domain-containing protein [Halogeometricum sp. S3BR5-2]MDS0295155.1 PGF-CTERM sorting domain-containing protein [Halogeometricum sp. S3BR5-2]